MLCPRLFAPYLVNIKHKREFTMNDNKGVQLQKLLNLVTGTRLRKATSGSVDVLKASESDKGRIIHSASFKRLQQKTQVFPLETNAAVRSRLTHSVEVAHIGRHLSQTVLDNLLENSTNPWDYEQHKKMVAFTNTVENACLLHDIGNPAFGHYGEDAIKNWFIHNFKSEDKTEDYKDFYCFDGNPQGFRLATYQSGFDEYGLNLTVSCILSTVKYPWVIDKKPTNKKKIGLFCASEQNYKDACQKLDWKEGKPFPLMLLMDTADDIANAMGNLEDAMENDVIRFEQLDFLLGKPWLELVSNNKKSASNKEQFLSFKTNFINKAVEMASNTFYNNLDNILEGDFDQKLIPDNGEQDIPTLFNKIGDVGKNHIFNNRAVEQVELYGNAVFKGLLDNFGMLLKLEKDDFIKLIDDSVSRKDKDPLLIRLSNRISKDRREKYLKEHRESDVQAEKVARAHCIVDFISGMTDDFSVETYQILQGIKF